MKDIDREEYIKYIESLKSEMDDEYLSYNEYETLIEYYKKEVKRLSLIIDKLVNTPKHKE